MKVEICSLDNGSGTNSKLRVYKHHFQHIFDSRPFCDIEEDDFIECCPNPDKAIQQMDKGKTIFNVSASKLEELSKRIYRY